MDIANGKCKEYRTIDLSLWIFSNQMTFGKKIFLGAPCLIDVKQRHLKIKIAYTCPLIVISLLTASHELFFMNMQQVADIVMVQVTSSLVFAIQHRTRFQVHARVQHYPSTFVFSLEMLHRHTNGKLDKVTLSWYHDFWWKSWFPVLQW